MSVVTLVVPPALSYLYSRVSISYIRSILRWIISFAPLISYGIMGILHRTFLALIPLADSQSPLYWCKVNNNFKEEQPQLSNYSHLFHNQLKTKNIVNWEKFRSLIYRLNPYLRSLLAKASFPPSNISQTCSLIPILCNNGIVKS